MSKKLAGKVAAVTDASKGIGASIANRPRRFVFGRHIEPQFGSQSLFYNFRQ